MKRLLLAPLLLGFIPFANANVDPKVAEFCLKAADFAGCIKTMTTKSTDIPSMRIIEGKTELSGNSCPNNFAYVGAGKCRSFVMSNTFRNALNIDGVGLWRAGQVEKPTWNSYYKLGENITKAIYDSKCPDKEPYLYTQNSCAEKPTPPSSNELRKLLGIAVVGGGKERIKAWDKKLERVYGIPNLSINAKKEKQKKVKTDVYSGSVRINCNSAVWRDKPRCN